MQQSSQASHHRPSPLFSRSVAVIPVPNLIDAAQLPSRPTVSLLDLGLDAMESESESDSESGSASGSHLTNSPSLTPRQDFSYVDNILYSPEFSFEQGSSITTGLQPLRNNSIKNATNSGAEGERLWISSENPLLERSALSREFPVPPSSLGVTRDSILESSTVPLFESINSVLSRRLSASRTDEISSALSSPEEADDSLPCSVRKFSFLPLFHLYDSLHIKYYV